MSPRSCSCYYCPLHSRSCTGHAGLAAPAAQQHAQNPTPTLLQTAQHNAAESAPAKVPVGGHRSLQRLRQISTKPQTTKNLAHKGPGGNPSKMYRRADGLAAGLEAGVEEKASCRGERMGCRAWRCLRSGECRRLFGQVRKGEVVVLLWRRGRRWGESWGHWLRVEEQRLEAWERRPVAAERCTQSEQTVGGNSLRCVADAAAAAAPAVK